MGAYSELDATLREGGVDFVDDDTLLEDDGPSIPNPDSTSAPPQAVSASAHAAQPVTAQPTDDKTDKAAKEQIGEDAKRKAHEEAEAQRKAEWKADKKKKKRRKCCKLRRLTT